MDCKLNQVFVGIKSLNQVFVEKFSVVQTFQWESFKNLNILLLILELFIKISLNA